MFKELRKRWKLYSPGCVRPQKALSYHTHKSPSDVVNSVWVSAATLDNFVLLD